MFNKVILKFFKELILLVLKELASIKKYKESFMPL